MWKDKKNVDRLCDILDILSGAVCKLLARSFTSESDATLSGWRNGDDLSCELFVKISCVRL